MDGTAARCRDESPQQNAEGPSISLNFICAVCCALVNRFYRTAVNTSERNAVYSKGVGSLLCDCSVRDIPFALGRSKQRQEHAMTSLFSFKAWTMPAGTKSLYFKIFQLNRRHGIYQIRLSRMCVNAERQPNLSSSYRCAV